MNENFGLKKALWSAQNTKKCAFDKCDRLILPNKEFYWDSMYDHDYCSQCGEVLRYKRKKATQRGESLDKIVID